MSHSIRSVLPGIVIAAAACGGAAPSTSQGAATPAASSCDSEAVDKVEREVAHGRIRAALRAVEQARVCPADKSRALILRLDLMFRLGRNDAARKLMEAERASIDPAHARVFQRRLELAASSSAQPAPIDEALNDLAQSHAAAALEGFNQALGQDGDDVRALIGAGQALAVLDRQRESRERLDHALDLVERLAGQPAQPVLLRNRGTDWSGTKVDLLPEGKEERVLYGKLRAWQPVQVLPSGSIASDGSIAVARQGDVWSILSSRSLRSHELGSFERVFLRQDAKYVLACAAGKKVLFDRLGNRLSEVAKPCGSGPVRFVGELVVETSPKHVEVSAVPSLRTVVDVPSDPSVLFQAQQLLLVPGVAPSDTARLVDLREGKLVATVHGKELSGDRFAPSPDGKLILWLDRLELHAIEPASSADKTLGSMKQYQDGPLGYLADGRGCIASTVFPAGKPPKGWSERCVVHVDHAATAVLVPAKAKLLARAADDTAVMNEAVSTDRKLAAFVEATDAKTRTLSALVLSTDADHPSVVQRIALAGPAAAAQRLRFSRDGAKLLVGEQVYDVSTGAKAAAGAPIDAVAEQLPGAWPEAGTPDGPAADKELPDPRVVAPVEVKPGPSITREMLFDPGGKGTSSTPVVLHDSITVERDRFGVVRWSSRGTTLASIVSFDQGRRYVAFRPDRKVEIVGGGAPPENLYCRVGRFLLPLETCREELLVRGEVDRLLSGAAPADE